MKELSCDLAKVHARFDQARNNLIAAGRAMNPNRIRSFFGNLEHHYLSNLNYTLSSSSVDFEDAAFNLDILTREHEILAEANELTLTKTEQPAVDRSYSGHEGLQTRVVIEGQIKNHTLSMTLEKVERTHYIDHSWKLVGSIDGRKLSDEDAAVLWVKFYTVLRRDEIRKEKREKEDAEAHQLQQKEAISREETDTYNRDVKPLFDELVQN